MGMGESDPVNFPGPLPMPAARTPPPSCHRAGSVPSIPVVVIIYEGSDPVNCSQLPVFKGYSLPKIAILPLRPCFLEPKSALYAGCGG